MQYEIGQKVQEKQREETSQWKNIIKSITLHYYN